MRLIRLNPERNNPNYWSLTVQKHLKGRCKVNKSFQSGQVQIRPKTLFTVYGFPEGDLNECEKHELHAGDHYITNM